MKRKHVFPFLAATILCGCASDSPSHYRLPLASKADRPTIVKQDSTDEAILQCIHDTGAIKNVTFAVGPFVDSTGKFNAVAPGSTGSFLPQSGSATYVTDTIRRGGGNVLVQYFGNAETRVPADYVINGIFNTLDFGTPINADVRVGGIGPTAQFGWAQLTLTIQMDVAATRMNRQLTMIERPVRYTQIGAGVGKTFGSDLVTGAIQFQDQQRLQFEAVNGPIATGVIDVILKEFPRAESCRKSTGPFQTRVVAEMK